LDRYYKGETSLEEEQILKEEVLASATPSPEADAFRAYKNEAEMPDGLEEHLFETILHKQKRKRRIVRTIFSITSAAAVLAIVFGVYLDFRERKTREMETQFMVMEQAIYHVSETLTPDEPGDMLVLWVDNNVEIIIN
jgi:hypothetical protein